MNEGTTMFISSVDHFRGVLLAILYRAQENLMQDGDLFSMALFRGPHVNVDLCTVTVPPPLVGPLIKDVMKEKAAEVEYVLYVTLGTVASPEECVREQKLPAEADNRQQCILVEGTHPDFGAHCVHAVYERPAQNDFVFKNTVIGTMKTSPMLDDIWPKDMLPKGRRLNS